MKPSLNCEDDYVLDQAEAYIMIIQDANVMVEDLNSALFKDERVMPDLDLLLILRETQMLTSPHGK